MKLKSIRLTMLVFCFVIGLPCIGISDDTIKWYSYNQGMEIGKSEKKIVFLHFYADWCRYCKIMNKETFKDPKVTELLNMSFVSIRINSDKEKKLATDYGVRGLPTSWFIKKNGEKIGPIPGYIPTSRFLPMLKKILTTENNDAL